MMPNAEQYRQIKESIRSNYKKAFDTDLDDDILYILIALYEVNKNISKEIRRIETPKISSKSDIVVYWLSKHAKDFVYLAIITLLIILLLYK